MLGWEFGSYRDVLDEELNWLEDSAERERISSAALAALPIVSRDRVIGAGLIGLASAPISLPCLVLTYVAIAKLFSLSALVTLFISFGVSNLISSPISNRLLPTSCRRKQQATELRRAVRQQARGAGYDVCAQCGYFAGGPTPRDDSRCPECGWRTVFQLPE